MARHDSDSEPEAKMANSSSSDSSSSGSESSKSSVDAKRQEKGKKRSPLPKKRDSPVRRRRSSVSPENKRKRNDSDEDRRKRRGSPRRDRRRSPVRRRSRSNDDSLWKRKEVKEEPKSEEDEPRRRSRSPRERRERRASPPSRNDRSLRDKRGGDRDRERRQRRSPERHRSPDRRDRNRRDQRDRRVKEEPDSPETNERGQKYGLEKKDRRKHDDGDEKWGKPEHWDEKRQKKEDEPPIEKEKVNLATSGKLAEDTNTFKGVVIKYNEPPEARKPIVRWRLYPFKGDEALPAMYIHRQSAYLIGRDRKVADIPVDHPSCSKQHAALQYRSVGFERDDGTKGRHTLPYIIDLASANGTYLNGKKLDPQRYYELQEKDIIKFGFSTREFVILSEKSTEEDSDQEPVSDRSDI